MKIGILAWAYDEPESIQLHRVAGEIGHSPLLFTFDDIALADRNGKLEIFIKKQLAQDLDVIISRAELRPSSWRNDLEKLMALSNLGTPPTIDPASTYLPADSKVIGTQKLSRAGLRVPPTSVCNTVESVRDLCQRYGEVVVKPSWSYGGTDVERVGDDFESKAQLIRDLIERYGSLVVQRFLPHPQGDIRITLIGSQPVWCIRRIPKAGAWKANVMQGARIAHYEPTSAILEIARQATETMGITISGVDIIEYEGNYVVLEINNVPGWYILPKEEGDRIARKVIAHAIQKIEVAA